MPRNLDEGNIWEYHVRGKIGFGLFVLLIGIFWLFRDLGYIPKVPLWPIIFISVGLFLILKKI